MRIGVLECDHVPPRHQHIGGDYFAMFRTLLPELDLVAYDARAGVLPSSASECEGWICTGSRASAYDGDGWIQSLAGFVRDAHAARTPFVGICFGHQLLAHALGGKVERASGGWGVGTCRTSVAEERPWMDPLQADVSLLYSHQDQVVALPSDAAVIGSAEHCPIAMLMVGDTMLGIQGHPEFSSAYLDALLGDRVDRVGEQRVREARRSLDWLRDEPIVAGWIVAFLRGG